MTVKNNLTREMLVRAIDTLREGVAAIHKSHTQYGATVNRDFVEFLVSARIVIELAEEKRLVPPHPVPPSNVEPTRLK